MSFNDEKKKANNALKNQKKSENSARKKQADIEKATADLNRKKDAGERKQASEEAQAKIASEKMMKELERQIKQVVNSSDFKGAKTKSAKKLISTFKNRKSTDKYFNEKILNIFKKNGKTAKQITGYFNSENYQAIKEGERSFRSLTNSLIHSLRLSKKDTLEWEDDLTKNNLYYHNDNIYTGDEFQEVNQKIFDKIISEKERDIGVKEDIQNIKDVARLSTSRTNYRKKVLCIAPENPALIRALNMLEKGDRKLKGLNDDNVSKIIDKTREIAFKCIQELNLSPAKAEQKRKNVENFFSIRQKHIEARSVKRVLATSQACLVKESVFKIPHNNGDLSSIEAQEYMDVAQAWFKKAYPEHNTLFGAIHMDETADATTVKEIDPETGKEIETDQLECRSGDNLHWFTDGKNSKTGEYDLRKAEIDFARKEQHKLKRIYGIDFGLDENKGYRLPDGEMTLIGQVLQMSFYTEMQKALFKHGFALKFLNSTQKKSFNYIQSCLQESLPLALRENSRFNMKKAMTEQAQQELEQTQGLTQEAKTELTEVNTQIGYKKTQKTELSSEILGMLGKKDQLSTDVENLKNKVLEQALNKVNKWMHDIQNGNDTVGFTALTASAAAKSIDKLSEEQPKIAEKVTKTAVTFEEEQEKAIEEHLKISNKLKNYKKEKRTSSKFKR